jgi:Bacterial Ig domain
MRRLFSMRSVLAAVFSLSLLAAACSNGSSVSAAGGDSLSITAPTDGATVSEPFTVKVTSSQALGDPSTGDDHVHLCFDGQSCDTEYKLVYGDTFQVDGLAPGQHTIEASLRHADHSAVGPTATITVTVTGGAAGSTSPAPASPSASRGYGY